MWRLGHQDCKCHSSNVLQRKSGNPWSEVFIPELPPKSGGFACFGSGGGGYIFCWQILSSQILFGMKKRRKADRKHDSVIELQDDVDLLFP